MIDTRVQTHWVAGGDLALPLKVCVQQEANSDILVWEPATDIYGIGPTLSAAVMDFRAALNQHRAVLESESARLAPRLVQQLAFLRKHLKP